MNLKMKDLEKRTQKLKLPSKTWGWTTICVKH